MATAKELELIDLSNKKVSEIEKSFNDNQGKKGCRIIQIVVLGGTPYLVIEKDIL